MCRLALPLPNNLKSMRVDKIKPKMSVKLVFPLVLLLCNLGAAAVYAAEGDYRRAAYWAASSICIAAVSF